MAVYSVVDNLRVCVVMVGLPARGKSLIAQKLVRYLSWLSINTKCFSVGNYRRKESVHPSADFFDPENEMGLLIRRQATDLAIKDMLEWFDNGDGVVGILDASNITNERRRQVLQIMRENQIEPIFLESYCDDQELIRKNVKDIQETSPDYKSIQEDYAIKDVLERISIYEKSYESIDVERDSDLTFVKLINVNTEIIINKIESYLESRIAFFVMNLHIKPRYIWLSRHGESQYNLEGKIGGDADLSERGWKYAKKLPSLVEKYIPNHEKLTVWTSTLKRTQQTGSYLPYPKKTWKALDELDAGVCDGMTYEEIAEKYPDDFKARDEDKFEYRYRGGESYRDVILRLEPIIMEMENQENVLIITHQAVLRCIYAYFMNVPQQQSPWMSIPLHTLIRLEPRAYETLVTRIKADIPAVSTYKEKGTSKLGESTKNDHSMAGALISSSSSKDV
ncbi:Fructose-2,6-bisphosphatase [Komagataella kurtzmanii]|nr:Fructose-2,6-bisphosphatase [Komagataella kurtzmanii]